MNNNLIEKCNDNKFELSNYKPNGTVHAEHHNNSDYTSVNSFYGQRRSDNVFELLKFFIDLDIYNSKYYDKNFEFFQNLEEQIFDDYSNINEILDIRHKKVIGDIKIRIEKLGLPKISSIVFSGRGYYLLWELKEKNKPSTTAQKLKYKKYYGVPKHLKNSYELVQEKLNELFKYFGADPKAKSVANLLRTINTINPKSNLICDIVHQTNNTYLFEEVADKVLDYTYAEVKKYKESSETITNKQLKLLKNKEFENFIRNIDVTTLSKKGASELIKSSLSNLKKNKNQSDNLNYIVDLLDKTMTNNLIVTGNRNVFCYYYGIGLKRKYKNDVSEKVLIIQTKLISNSLGLNEKEVKRSLLSGINANTDKVSKLKLLKILNIDPQTIDHLLKRKNSRTTKDNIKSVKFKIFSNWKQYKNVPVRTLECKFKISKSSINNIKKEIANYMKLRKKSNFLKPSLNEMLNNEEKKLRAQNRIILIGEKSLTGNELSLST